MNDRTAALGQQVRNGFPGTTAIVDIHIGHQRRVQRPADERHRYAHRGQRSGERQRAVVGQHHNAVHVIALQVAYDRAGERTAGADDQERYVVVAQFGLGGADEAREERLGEQAAVSGVDDRRDRPHRAPALSPRCALAPVAQPRRGLAHLLVRHGVDPRGVVEDARCGCDGHAGGLGDPGERDGRGSAPNTHRRKPNAAAYAAKDGRNTFDTAQPGFLRRISTALTGKSEGRGCAHPW